MLQMLMKFDKSFTIFFSMLEGPHTNNHSHNIIMLQTYLLFIHHTSYVYKNV